MSQADPLSPAGVSVQPPTREWLFRKTDEAVEADGVVETFESSESHVASPWGNGMQHGGPVAGLLARSMECLGERPNTRLSRITMNLLGAVPVVPLRSRARVVRPGRRIELLAATVEALGRDGQWGTVATAEGWRLATQPTEDVQHQTVPDMSFDASSGGLPVTWPADGFAGSLGWGGLVNEARRGAPTEVWLRMQHDLVEGEHATALQELIAISDCANGIGARLDPAEFTFLNTDLAIHLHNPPQGPWFGLEAETTIGPDGIGLSHAVLHDANGPLGRLTQNVLVERR